MSKKPRTGQVQETFWDHWANKPVYSTQKGNNWKDSSGCNLEYQTEKKKVKCEKKKLGHHPIQIFHFVGDRTTRIDQDHKINKKQIYHFSLGPLLYVQWSSICYSYNVFTHIESFYRHYWRMKVIIGYYRRIIFGLL